MRYNIHVHQHQSTGQSQSAQSVLHLHNISFVHARADLFFQPKTVTTRRMFGRYFHALTTHAPLLYRLIPLCLLNVEFEKHMFGQCKAITRNTSSQHTSHIISNILLRIDSENKAPDCGIHTIALKLARVLPPKLTWLQTSLVHYQAHLERISDYLLEGPSMWWQYVDDGVEFF